MDSAYIYTPANDHAALKADTKNRRRRHTPYATDYDGPLPEFKPITHSAMQQIWPILSREAGRTTDFSYGGVLMWVDYFKYEYAIISGTLFIKGLVEDDLTKTAFSLPVGNLPLSQSVDILKAYCNAEDIRLVFSAIPDYAADEMLKLSPSFTAPLDDWSDYLYDAEALSTLRGKKYNKKRNHVNKFTADNPAFTLEPIDSTNASEAMAFMDIFDTEGDSSPMAISERKLTRGLISLIAEGDSVLEGALLKTGNRVCAFTIGDIKGDTLFIHVEKATREVAGSYEAINKLFAEYMCAIHPEIKYINREDDAGDLGLRMAKESYHPLKMLRKFNVAF